MTAWQDIREIDLMAYADGLLEDDSARKAAVEAYLGANPAEAARVEAMERDNRELRELYAGELERPVPRRILRTLHEPAPKRFQFQQAIAAGVVLVILAGGGGWLAGQRGDEVIAISSDMLREVARNHVSADALPTVGKAASRTVNGAMLSAAAQNVHVEIPLPDLSAEGFDLAEREQVTVAGNEMIRLVYRSPDTTLNLFVRLHQGRKAASLRREKSDDVYAYHWSVGPLAYALTTDTPEHEAAQLARMVLDAVESASIVNERPATAAGPADEGETVAGEDATFDRGRFEEPEPRPVHPSQFN